MLGIGLSIWSRVTARISQVTNYLLDIGGDRLLDIDGQELEE
jgi:hypothetical protein